jgi:hypothetical protein
LTTELLKCLLSGIANPTTKPQVAVQLTTVATVLEESYRLTPTVLGHQPVDLPRVATAPAVPAVTAILSLTAILAAEAATAGASHTELEGESVAEATQIATSLVSRAAGTMPVAESRKFGATNPQARMTASPPSLHGFAIYFSRRNSNRWESPSTMLTVKICQPSHEFTFGVGISFIPHPLVLTPVV